MQTSGTPPLTHPKFTCHDQVWSAEISSALNFGILSCMTDLNFDWSTDSSNDQSGHSHVPCKCRVELSCYNWRSPAANVLSTLRESLLDHFLHSDHDRKPQNTTHHHCVSDGISHSLLLLISLSCEQTRQTCPCTHCSSIQSHCCTDCV